MKDRLVDRIPFAKILIGLTIVFGLSLGLCGLGFVSYFRGEDMPSGASHLMNQAIGLDVLVMVLSAVGVVATGVVWVVMGLVSGFSRRDAEPQRLFEDKDDEDKLR